MVISQVCTYVEHITGYRTLTNQCGDPAGYLPKRDGKVTEPVYAWSSGGYRIWVDWAGKTADQPQVQNVKGPRASRLKLLAHRSPPSLHTLPHRSLKTPTAYQSGTLVTPHLPAQGLRSINSKQTMPMIAFGLFLGRLSSL
jgi:hypothetical protein